MIRKVEYTEWIDSYLDDELTDEQKKEFESELKVNAVLAEELKLHIELQEALTEKDVMNLKENLNTISDSYKSENQKLEASFDLIEELEEFNEFDTKVDPKELLNYYESLPKLHIYQHEIASKENVHHFYKEQELTRSSVEEEEVISDEALMMEVEEAVMEKDVLELRENLKQVAESMPDHDYSQEQVDDYINGTMPEGEVAEFEKEMALNPRLAEDVKLHREIEGAVLEGDIISLRSKLADIMETQASYHQDFTDIEKYLEKGLAEEELAEFENEMYENSDLKRDVKLHREVEQASAEGDVMELRDNLKEINKEIESKKEKSVIRLDTSWKSAFVRYSAAVVVLIAFGVSFILKLQPVSNEQLYGNYYVETEAIGVSRGIDMENQLLNNGKELMNAGNYEQASILFRVASNNDENNAIPRFLLGSSLQNLKKWKEAIEEYKVVAANNENTFKEQAEFNIGLCYLIQDDRKKAVEQFRRVSRNGGHYKPDAQAILRKLKFENKE